MQTKFGLIFGIKNVKNKIGEEMKKRKKEKKKRKGMKTIFVWISKE